MPFVSKTTNLLMRFIDETNILKARILVRISLLLALISLLSYSSSMAQTRGFSKDPTVYIEEMGEHVKSTKKPIVSETFDKFKVQWLSGIYTEDQQSMVIRISEYMLLNKFAIDPDFNLYMNTLLVAKDSTVSEEKFNNWISETYKLIKSNRKAYKIVLQTSYNVFNERALYVSKSKKWRFNETDFKFVFKGNEVNIELKLADLTCKGPDDEINIYGTSGVYDIVAESWKGEGGTVNWSRVGIKPSVAYAKLKDYSIDMNQGQFTAHNVSFQYKGVLGEVVEGSLIDKISSGKLSDKKKDFSNSSYPRFEADRKDLVIDNFNDASVKFKGGFALEGRIIHGKGDKDNKASFEFYHEGELVVKAVSSNFSIKDGKIISLETEMTIYTDSGEVYHPMIRMSFLQKDRALIFTRGDKGLEQAPLFDTDHNLEIWVDQVKWKLDEPKIDFDMILNDDKARFESTNFYREFNFERLTLGMMSYHPIIKMHQYIVLYRAREFSLGEYARYLDSKKENLYPQIFKLADEGFIYYDLETEMIRPKNKLFNYYKNHFKLADYDVIRFNSVIGSKSNASLNLINYDLKIQGIPMFRFSDSQNVMAIPRDQIVTVKNNRKMVFDGSITAGRFDFFGEKFNFDYPSFTVSSDKIDSMKIYFPDTINQRYLIPVKSVLRDINGTLYIDRGNNKSGLTDYPEYPRFISRSPSIIAYDKKHIFNGAYKKDVFRFEVDPFTIDSMDNFTIAGLKFPGTFVSAGILPEFRYEASIMKDYSLGFTKSSPPGGYSMYDGKGQGNIDVSLSEEGFWAKGEINYEGAIMKSSKIVMMPDSLNAEVDEYSIKRNSRYPRLFASDVSTHWLPKEEVMYVNTKDHDVDVFDDGQLFKGNLKQTPAQLSGNGVLSWDNAALTSQEVRFAPVLADAAISNIRIGDVDAGMISFVSDNVKSHIDFEKRTGDFRANEKGHLTKLQYNQFTSTMDDFKWDMDRKTILMTATGRMKTQEYVFKSTNPAQDGLSFISTKALFDMNDGVIYAEEIPYIDIADSRVFPNDGKATIEKDAYIRPLENSKLLAARDNKYHELYDCKISVLGRNAIAGSGYYLYKDKHTTGQIIYFDKLKVMNDTTIRALGNLTDSMRFVISPKIAYKGTVELNSTKNFLGFNGYVLPLHTFKEYPSTWFRYSDRPDPSNIIISAHAPKNKERKKIYVSMNYAPVDSLNVYPTFFNFKRAYSDLEITSDTGVIFYDEEAGTFVAGDSNKALNGARKGSILKFNETDRTITSEGRLNLELDFHEKFNMITAGTVSKHEDDTIYNIQTLLGMNIKLPDECWYRMKEVIEKNGTDAPSYTLDQEFTKRVISEFVEGKKYNKIVKEIEEMDELNPIDEIKNDILITKVNLHYSSALRALVSTDKIDLAYVDDLAVKRSYNSRILVESRRSGTRFVFYLEVSKYDWFYFEYQRGNLYIYSTDKEFNDAIRQKSRKINERGFTIRSATPIKVSRQIEKIDVLTSP
jgi:hypothetical protein